MEKTLKNLFTSNDVCCKIAVLEICFEKKTKESVSTASTVGVPCYYIKDAFAGFCQQFFEKQNYFRR